jgi:hypothetical protein
MCAKSPTDRRKDVSIGDVDQPRIGVSPMPGTNPRTTSSSVPVHSEPHPPYAVVSGVAQEDAFRKTRDRCGELIAWLGDEEARSITHAEMEQRLMSMGRSILRQGFQDHLDLRALMETPVAVQDQVGRRRSPERNHRRPLTTIVGEVTAQRIAYRRRRYANLHPADGLLNLPVERHSHGIRELAAVESSRGSFDEARDALRRSTGVDIGKRQVEELTRRAATDVDAFYAQMDRPPAPTTDVLVLSFDGKGIVMRPEALREATAQAAARARDGCTGTRVDRDDRGNRKRIAEVAAVYDVTPVPRTAEDIFVRHGEQTVTPGPVATGKWVTASVVESAASVVHLGFEEAQKRDPHHRRRWVALVDGANHQIDCIKAEAAAREVEVTILIDCIHVLEYLHKAARCFYPQSGPEADEWVVEKARAILDGKSSTVAASITRKATCLGLADAAREGADVCASYLLNKTPYLDYPTALAAGWPLATGIIEGACRHLIQDRLGITGARWGLDGAEAVLKLRAVRTNGDWPAYWRFHLQHERQRVHCSRYRDSAIPIAA